MDTMRSENYIHALSQINFHHNLGTNLPVWSRASPIDRNHLASLDGLALLLVFGPKDVAAMSFWRSADRLKLLWAKNQPVDDPSQLRYIEVLLETARNGANASELLDIVIPMCREKMFSRIKKLAKSFGMGKAVKMQAQSNLWLFDKTKEPHQRFEAELRNHNILKDGQTTIQVLDDFTRFLGYITMTSNKNEFMTILYASWQLTLVAGINGILEKHQVRRLKKLGDYMEILRRVPYLVNRFGTARITTEQVRPPAAKLIDVFSGSLDILNLRCNDSIYDKYFQPIKNWSQVTDMYPNAKQGEPPVGKKRVKFSQHCEITLALNMFMRIQPKVASPKIEIGISKACCEWCYEYLSLLSSNCLILFRDSNGKLPDGWMIPVVDGLELVTQQMEQFIKTKVDNVIWGVNVGDIGEIFA